MSDGEALTDERSQALAAALATSLKTVTQMWERQMSTLLAFGAILAAMPQTADVDPKRVGAMVHLLSSKQPNPEKLRDEMTRMASMIIGMSQRLREAAEAEKPVQEDVAGQEPGPPSDGSATLP